jgi:quercetin dioxygenase-like cupin family protein
VGTDNEAQLVEPPTTEVFPPGAQSHSLAADDMTFFDTGARGVDGNTKIEASDAYGSLVDGKHGSFFRFSPGFVSPLHSHTDDYGAIVIEGEMANYQPGETPTKLGPGSFWFQKGKQSHTTVCYSDTGCLAFIIQGNKFDAQVPPVTE